MRAVTDRATPISLTNHAYFNLGGVSEPACLRGIEDHDLAVAASRYLPVNDQAIPLADAPAPVDAVFDLRGAARLGIDVAERARHRLQFEPIIEQQDQRALCSLHQTGMLGGALGHGFIRSAPQVSRIAVEIA